VLRRIQRLVLLAFVPSLAHAQPTIGYSQSNLISVKAQKTDTQLINPWGVAIGQQTPFWINTAGSGMSEVYDAGANRQFVVTIPAAGAAGKTGSPTGIVFNPSTTDFALPKGSAALFIFDPFDGTVSAWNPSITNAVVADSSASGAVYTLYGRARVAGQVRRARNGDFGDSGGSAETRTRGCGPKPGGRGPLFTHSPSADLEELDPVGLAEIA
jgi:hypothetical protein